jgi:hypothetical protein
MSEIVFFGRSFKMPSKDGDSFADWCLENVNYHRNDFHVTFDETEHKYFYNDEMITNSVTQLIERYFEKFDGVKVATKMMNGAFWPRDEYTHQNGISYTLTEILAKWDEIGIDARNRG